MVKTTRASGPKVGGKISELSSVRECLEKDPADRTPEDIDILLEFTQTFPAFFNMTLATRRALCAGKETQLK